jgi:hypothetical protein
MPCRLGTSQELPNGKCWSGKPGRVHFALGTHHPPATRPPLRGLCDPCLRSPFSRAASPSLPSLTRPEQSSVAATRLGSPSMVRLPASRALR